MEKKRVYVADIHMNAGLGWEVSNVGHPYEWLSPDEAEQFAAFLRYLNDAKTEVEEVVIIGDLMDDWVYPVNVVPPSLQDILDAKINRNIVKALRALLENKSIAVVYLPGNHDMGVTEEFVHHNFKGMVFGGSTFHDSIYRTGRLRAEHGSAHSLFNAPPVRSGGGMALPLGYFISRVVATKARDTGSAKRHYWSYADDLIEIIGPQKLATSVFEAILEEAGLDDTTEIRIPKRSIAVARAAAKNDVKKKRNGKSEVARDKEQSKEFTCVTAGEVKEEYADLYDRWEVHNGKGSGFKAIMAEIGLLGPLADGLCKKSDTNIVVFGHSHDWKLDKDAFLVPDRIYANCGTWCDDKKLCTWVESQKDRDGRRHYIRVMDWNKGNPQKLDEADVPL